LIRGPAKIEPRCIALVTTINALHDPSRGGTAKIVERDAGDAGRLARRSPRLLESTLEP
jgi:hypothetical protein